ncbi:MAG: U32 family peptidase [Bacteroidales bacterium]|nr:U32 family peptidase [Bacteroidales bacterium]
MRDIELLSPAKNLQCGIEAILHGADAVYIGAPKFGARAAAGNSIEDIRKLCSFAHPYGVRIYVALNTILSDEELVQAEKIIWQLYQAGVDALIVQDMGITQLNLPPITLHASTQMDNRTPEKVRFLHEAGFKQVVLARELSLQQINDIHRQCPDTALEVFVHGALCVSYSGRCYASEHCYHRSANRGECAQFCRLAFDLEDATGKKIIKNRHLLSLKDLCQIDILEQLLDAGVSSLKIEGRLKEVSYVKNVTAAYRQALDSIIASRSNDYQRASLGNTQVTFTPSLEKSFNRGFTHYFAQGRIPDISQPHTPKSIGERMGTVKEQRNGTITVAGLKPWHNGDGVCYIDREGMLQGFRVNSANGNKLIPAGRIAQIPPRTLLYRNYDQEFERELSRPSATRKIAVTWELNETRSGYALSVKDESGLGATLHFPAEKQDAQTPQQENIRRQLSKLGDTIFTIDNRPQSIITRFFRERFIPPSLLTDWRRQVIERLYMLRRIHHRQELSHDRESSHPFGYEHLDYTGNVFNEQARNFYSKHQVKHIEPAYEQTHQEDSTLMLTKHCIRYALGWCSKEGKPMPYQEPLFLRSADGRCFELGFNCKRCEMTLKADSRNRAQY